MSADRDRVIRDAHALALRAKCGENVRREGYALAVQARTALGVSDLLSAAIDEFWCALTGNRDFQTAQCAGLDLERAVIRYLRPDPCDLSRVDIHG
jgi:hypothetical protein